MGRKKLTDNEKKLAKIKRLEAELAKLRKEVNTRPNIEMGQEVDTTVPDTSAGQA